jgi:glycosyltransferase involved in cell wall biosynthesis
MPSLDRPAAASDPWEAPEVSIVLPCLNEGETLAGSIEAAMGALRDSRVHGEVIVADNGSTDDSAAIAVGCGATVVRVLDRGYGNALRAGIAAARGRFVVMGDADQSYDFGELPKFVEGLRKGYDLVQGCRLPAGGGRIAPGAMPLTHRWVGNPLFSLMVRSWFGAPIHDVYCGMRGFRRSWHATLNQRCTGMEFATEMIIKASLLGARIAEVPITLHKDRRVSRRSHLRTFADGWRTLRFFLMYSPKWLFLVPGVGLIVLGILGYALALPGASIGTASLDAHTLVFASLAILSGYQVVLFAFCTKIFAIREGLIPGDPRMAVLFRYVNLERGLVVGLATTLVGFVLLSRAVWWWWLADFGSLDYARTMRIVVPGATAAAVGVQTVFGSFFASILGMERETRPAAVRE